MLPNTCSWRGQGQLYFMLHSFLTPILLTSLKNDTCKLILIYYWLSGRGRDSSVGIATSYGLDSPGSYPGGGRAFSAPVQIGSGAHPVSYTMDTGLFQG